VPIEKCLIVPERSDMIVEKGGKMNEKRSIRVIILGWLLVAIGSLKYIYLLYGKDSSLILFSLFPHPHQLVFVWPFLLILVGAGILLLRNWVRRIFIVYLWINIAVMSAVTLATFMVGMGYYSQPLNNLIKGALYWIVIFIFPSGLYLFLLTRRGVKEQFK
jgi:hypothetical protein